jgi:putative membrane protein
MSPARALAAIAALAALAAAAAGRAYTDSEILGVVSAEGRGVLEAAEVAGQRARSDAVRKLADRTRRELEDFKQDAADAASKAGVTPADSGSSLDLGKRAAEETAALSARDAEEFDAAYVDAQASDAAELLRLLDEQLIPDARAPSVADLLRRLRASAARRLEHARRLQTAVKSPS